MASKELVGLPVMILASAVCKYLSITGTSLSATFLRRERNICAQRRDVPYEEQ